ncbi:MAG: hypothetical protein AAFW95_12955 [Cyanobacteria bacterium J06638_6]
MIAVAVGLNLLIALFCLYVAWRLWRLSKILGRVADSMTNWERNTHNTLNPAVTPSVILRGQTGTAALRGRYSQLQGQVQRLNQAIAVVSLIPMASRWVGIRRVRPGGKLARSRKTIG